jgi:hexosaminidase
VAARIFLPDGRAGAVRRSTISRTTLRAAALVDVAMEPGLRVDLFQGSFRRVADLERRGQTAVRTDPVESVGIPSWITDEQFGLRFRGYLDVPEDGVYTFRLTSDDGAVLRFSGATLVDHDGLHGTSPQESQVALAKGLHPFEVLYFQAGGGKALQLEWRAPEGDFTPVDGTSALRIR